jgi:uncharacterized protein YkwD
LVLESLEERTVPTTAALSGNGVLTVLGSGGADLIQISQANGQLSVSGVAQTFAAGSVNTVVVDAGEGDDVITVAPSVTQTTWLFGGGGNDSIQGGSGVNHIYGAAGNDTLMGGSGGDSIFGGTGTNSVSGPGGARLSAGSPFMTAALSPVAQQILDLTNQFRAQNGVAPVAYSAQLTSAADLQVANMVSMVPYVGLTAAMSHTLNGVPQPTMTSRLNTVGYDYYAAGENIAYGFADANAVFQAWVNSPGHRANLLNPSYTQLGVSLAYTPDGVPYYAQEFGVPSANNPTGPSPVTTSPTSGGSTTPSSTALAQPPTGYGAGPVLAGGIYAVGTDAGVPGVVTVYDAASGTVKFNFAPYGTAFTGGVRVATGDMNGDGRPDLIVAPGAGISPLVKIYDGVTGNLIRSFYAYSTGFTGGVNLAVGDVNGDGRPDIVTGADAGGGPHVQVFDGQSLSVIQSFFAYGPTFAGGVRVAVGDVNGDGRADIVTGAGAGGGPHVKVFSGANGGLMQSFYAFAPTFAGGVFVAAGDLNGDGKADLVVGAGFSGGPHVRAFDGTTNAELASFYASTPTFTGGIRVRTMDVDGDGRAEILTGTGFGSREVRLYKPSGLVLSSFLAGDPTNLNGVFVG